jgi:hypothetical protein
MKKIVIILAGLVLLAASSAWAKPLTLSFTDGIYQPVTVVDGAENDFNPQANAVTYAGKVGKSWFSISSGLFGAALGQGFSEMVLDSVDIRTAGSNLGNLIITLSSSAGNWSGPGAVAQVSGLGFNTAATFTTKVAGNVVSTLSFPQGGVHFDGQEAFNFSPGPEDVIDLIATIAPRGLGAINFNYSLTPVPEASTILFVGAGFMGLAIYCKRRKNA